MFAASISVGVGMTLWCGLGGLRTRQGRAAPGGGQALMRSRPAGQMGPGTAGESFAGQQGCGSRLSGLELLIDSQDRVEVLQRGMAATIFSGRLVHSHSDGEARIMAYRSLRDTCAAVVMPLRFIARNWGSGHDTAMTHGPHGTLAFGSMELRVLNVLQWRGAHAA